MLVASDDFGVVRIRARMKARNGTDISVLLVDDHEVVRRGLTDYLRSKEGVRVVAEAATGAEALVAVEQHGPDVAILDIRLPDMDGVTLCRQIRDSRPSTACLMLTSFPDEDAILQAAIAGASGYLLKDVRLGAVLDAIRLVAAGESLLDPQVVARVVNRMRHNDKSGRLKELTPQERRVFDLMAKGETNRAIAEELSLAEQTVKNYSSNVLMKLGLARRAQAGAFAADERGRPLTPP